MGLRSSGLLTGRLEHQPAWPTLHTAQEPLGPEGPQTDQEVSRGGNIVALSSLLSQ